MNVKTKVY